MKILSSILALVLVSTSAFAADATHLAGRFGVGIAGGIPIPTAFSRFRDTTNSGWSVAGSGDYYFTDAFGIEIQYQHMSFEGGQPIDNTYTLGFNYRWFPTARVTPVLGLAAGWGLATGKQNLDVNNSNFLANGKLGFDITLSDAWILEAAAKYQWFFSKGSGSRDQQALIPQLGLTYFFGSRKSEATEVAPVMTPAPTPAKVVDGDDDGDGVPNSIDKCPNTPAGAKVNSLGCQITEKVNQSIDIEFPSGKATITADYEGEADKIVSLMKDHDDLKAEIQGYTDNVGSKTKNQKLSEQRANSVRNYIVKHGIAKSRVTAKGYGESSPIAENSTADGRKQNRRVIAEIQSK